jgi:hypothetical protein
MVSRQNPENSLSVNAYIVCYDDHRLGELFVAVFVRLDLDELIEQFENPFVLLEQTLEIELSDHPENVSTFVSI